jgi:hypothetical protein
MLLPRSSAYDFKFCAVGFRDPHKSRQLGVRSPHTFHAFRGEILDEAKKLRDDFGLRERGN